MDKLFCLIVHAYWLMITLFTLCIGWLTVEYISYELCGMTPTQFARHLWFILRVYLEYAKIWMAGHEALHSHDN